jgi:hypothetical protein
VAIDKADARLEAAKRDTGLLLVAGVVALLPRSALSLDSALQL